MTSLHLPVDASATCSGVVDLWCATQSKMAEMGWLAELSVVEHHGMVGMFGVPALLVDSWHVARLERAGPLFQVGTRPLFWIVSQESTPFVVMNRFHCMQWQVASTLGIRVPCIRTRDRR